MVFRPLQYRLAALGLQCGHVSVGSDSIACPGQVDSPDIVVLPVLAGQTQPRWALSLKLHKHPWADEFGLHCGKLQSA